MKTSVKMTDGGKPQGFRDEQDCTVCALANASGVGYEVAHILMEDAGRKQNGLSSVLLGLMHWKAEGFGDYRNIPVSSDALKYNFGRHYSTLAQFARRYSTGSFIVRCSNGDGTSHVMAIVNGVILNNEYGTSVRKRVNAAWELLPEKVLDSGSAV
jgi:hypothetical protein